jgi:hypothetical protein
MPSTSKKQHNFMEAVANNPSFAKKVGVPQSVGKEFANADKGKKFGSGGTQTRADRQVVNQPKTDHGAEALFKQGGLMATKMNPGFMAMMAKKKAGTKKMAMGGEPMGKVKTAAPSKDGVAAKGKTKGMMPKMAGTTTGMKRGGMTKKKMMK